jgi:hypothetical protein
MESFKENLKTDLASMVNDYFDHKRKRNTTSYMCWLKDNRERFEVCSKCDIPFQLDETKKKKCPKCNAKISATEVAKMAGAEWTNNVSPDIKQKYVVVANKLNKT